MHHICSFASLLNATRNLCGLLFGTLHENKIAATTTTTSIRKIRIIEIMVLSSSYFFFRFTTDANFQSIRWLLWFFFFRFFVYLFWSPDQANTYSDSLRLYITISLFTFFRPHCNFSSMACCLIFCIFFFHFFGHFFFCCCR